MEIEAKLDEIIARLTRIEAHLGISTEPPAIDPHLSKVTEKKPTNAMLKFKRMIEFANEMDQKFYFSAIRKRAAELMEIRKTNPNWRITFKPQMLKKIDEKIDKTGAQFYKDLRKQSETFASAVETEGEKVLQRAINRLQARA